MLAPLLPHPSHPHLERTACDDGYTQVTGVAASVHSTEAIRRLIPALKVAATCAQSEVNGLAARAAVQLVILLLIAAVPAARHGTHVYMLHVDAR